MGLEGAIIMRYPDGYDATDEYEETILQFTWQYVISYQLCYNTTNNVTSSLQCPAEGDARFSVPMPGYYDLYEYYFETLGLTEEADGEEYLSAVNIIGSLADNSMCDI